MPATGRKWASTSDPELRQAEADYEATAQLVPQALLAISRQEDALSALAGDPPAPIARGVAFDALQQPALPDTLPLRWFAVGRTSARPNSRWQPRTPRWRRRARCSCRKCGLSATGGAVLSAALGDPVAIWSLGGSVLAPLFNAGRNQAQFDTAEARRDQAAFAYRRTVLTAFREVEDNLAATKRLREQLVNLEAGRVALEGAFQHARNRYEAGYSAYLEQLEAQRALLNTELSLVQTESEALNATVGVFQAVGGGWSPDETGEGNFPEATPR